MSGYRALTGFSATKTNTPIEQIPQSIAVLPRSIVDDQKSRTQSEALANISSVTGMPTNYLYGWNYKVRGFEAERYVDGLANYNDGGDYTSMINTERIEVLKGPGLFYQSGLGTVGGVINTISKLPTPVRLHHFGINAGGFGTLNPWFDINEPLNAERTALFRITGELDTSRDFIDVIDRQRYSLNPTLMLADGERTSLTIQGRLSYRTHQTYVGLPGTGTIDQSAFSIRRSLFIGDPNIPKAESENNGITAQLSHKFDDVWSVRAIARYAETRLVEPAQVYFFNTPTFGSTFSLLNYKVPERSREFSASPWLTADFDLGHSRNTLLFGADYNRIADRATSWASFAGLVEFANPNPAFPPFANPIGNGQVLFDADSIFVNRGLTAQLQSTVGGRLHLLAGLRWAMVDIRSANPTLGTSFHTDAAKIVPRFGAGFDLARGVTVFGSYSEGLRGVRFFSGPDAPKPEESKQIEGGIKLALPYGLAGTIGVFDIVRRNVVTADPANPFLQVQTGEQRSQGFDADITWQPIRGLSMLMSYAHVVAQITKDNSFPVGSSLERVPRDSGRVWVNYKVQSGPFANLAVGAGVYAASRQAISLSDQFFTPGFVTFDGKVEYDAGPWSLALIGRNLANRRYFVPYPYFQGRVAPGEPLTLMASASIKR